MRAMELALLIVWGLSLLGSVGLGVMRLRQRSLRAKLGGSPRLGWTSSVVARPLVVLAAGLTLDRVVWILCAVPPQPVGVPGSLWLTPKSGTYRVLYEGPAGRMVRKPSDTSVKLYLIGSGARMPYVRIQAATGRWSLHRGSGDPGQDLGLPPRWADVSAWVREAGLTLEAERMRIETEELTRLVEGVMSSGGLDGGDRLGWFAIEPVVVWTRGRGFRPGWVAVLERVLIPVGMVLAGASALRAWRRADAGRR